MLKNLIFLTILMVVTSCSSLGIDEEILQSNSSPNHAGSVSISESQALWIAKKVLSTTTTRSYIMDPEVEYVLSDNKTKSSIQDPDTLAYIFNFSDHGFAIIGTEMNVNPVLAYSASGYFTLQNQLVKENFISNLENYYSENSSSTANIDDFDSCYQSIPFITAFLNQGNPWNKYVVLEHPDCPTGCVAVATANIICNSKLAINYHNSKFQLKSMILAIGEHPTNLTLNSDNMRCKIKAIAGVSRIPKYSYEQAVDSMAKLLYLIGQDLNMDYNPNGSAADSRDAYNLCKNIGLNVVTNYLSFNLLDAFNYLLADHIIYMRGVAPEGGHAWVCDGYSYCTDQFDKTKITKRYIHIDWGWGGSCNGYYNGEVFEAGRYNFEPQNYFAIKRDSNLEIYKFEDN